MHKQWPGLSVTSAAQKLLVIERRAPLQRGCSTVWPADRGMSSAGSPCTTRRPYHNGPRGSRSCVTVSLEMSSTTVGKSGDTSSSWGIHCHPLCFTGWQSGSIHSWWIGLPECRVASSGLGKVQYYSTSGSNKDVPPQSPSGGPPSAEQVLSAATKGTAPPARQCKLKISFFKIHVNDVTHQKYWVSFAKKKKCLSCPSKCLQLVQVLKSHENHGIYCWNVFTTVGSTQQGLTKAETIQVKGDECLHIPRITVKDCFVAESG